MAAAERDRDLPAPETEPLGDTEVELDEGYEADVDEGTDDELVAVDDRGRGGLMKLVLRTDVDQVGKKGDIVDVADGYGRNYLVPKGLAFLATDGVADQAASHAQEPRPARRAGPGGRRGGRPQARAAWWSPSPPGPAPRASSSARSPPPTWPRPSPPRPGIEIDRRKLHLDEPIKAVGTHLVPAKLHAEVEFPITVEVVAS